MIRQLANIANERKTSMTGEGEQIAKFLPFFSLNHIRVGQTYASGQLPLHVTVFPPIQESYDREYGDNLRDFLSGCEPFDAVAEGEDWFGPENDIKVKRIKDSLAIIGLHAAHVKHLGELKHDPTYTLPYRPHVTVREFSQIPDGSRIRVDSISIASKRKSGLWTIVDEFKIGPHHD